VTGLIVGREPLVPWYAATARWHTAVMLAIAAVMGASELLGGAVAGAMLLARCCWAPPRWATSCGVT
jgi:hypothetical protein